MDALAFDRKFARFVSQTDSTEIRLGTELFESGAVRLGRLDELRIEGSVDAGRNGVFAAVLNENAEGGFSGACECDTFFNCRHSYALARAAREHVVVPYARPAEPEERKPGSRPPHVQRLEKRLGRPANAKEREFAEAAELCWKRARGGAWTFYPSDLSAFVEKGSLRGLPPQEPLRAMKRLLGPEGPSDSLVMADALKGFCDFKEIPWKEEYAHLVDAAEPSRHHSERIGPLKSEPGFVQTVRIRSVPRLEGDAERDWFRISARYEAERGGFDAAEIDRLLGAGGDLVRIEGKGWLRAELLDAGPMQSAIQALGLDPARGNSHRIHALQLAEFAELEAEAGAIWKQARSRAQQLASEPSPDPPQRLSGILRPYQVDGFKFLCRLSELGFGGILADDMGLGKTLQTLAWLLWLSECRLDGRPLRALIVCPKSVSDNWIQEAVKFDTGLAAAPFRSANAQDGSLNHANLIVANYTQLRLSSSYFLSQEWDAVVLDEGQYIKSPDAQTTRIAWKLSAARRVVLTGTPIENSLIDLWSLMRFAMPRLLGPQAAFLANYVGMSEACALDGLRRRVRPFLLRRLKSEVAKDLPERIEEEIHCEMEPEQAALYEAELEKARQLLRDMSEEGAGSAQRLNFLNLLLRLRQICCDPRLIGEQWKSAALPCKLQALLDIVESLAAEGHKVLVFSQFVSMLERIDACLSDRGIGALMLTGKTLDRKAVVDRFQSSTDESVFLLSLKAAGSGLNLTAASYVVLFDPWWNPAVEAQAIDRAHRIGQSNNVVAYRLLAKGTIEEKIRRIQAEKAELARSIIGETSLSSALDLATLEELLR